MKEGHGKVNLAQTSDNKHRDILTSLQPIVQPAVVLAGRQIATRIRERGSTPFRVDRGNQLVEQAPTVGWRATPVLFVRTTTLLEE